MSPSAYAEAVEKLEAAAESVVRRVGLLQIVPAEAQLLTEAEALELLGISRKKFYTLRLPRYSPDAPRRVQDSRGRRYVRAAKVRYRLVDLVAHIDANMRDADGHQLQARAMKRRRVPGAPSTPTATEEPAE